MQSIKERNNRNAAIARAVTVLLLNCGSACVHLADCLMRSFDKIDTIMQRGLAIFLMKQLSRCN